MMGLIVIPSQQVSATGDPTQRVPESELQLQMHHPKVMPVNLH
jgi:hypothetical protein